MDVKDFVPKVAVWMLTYNHEKFISEAITSILMQETSFSFKIFIGEDCSTDSTRLICQKLKEKYPEKIVLLLNSENKGQHKNARLIYEACITSGAKYIAMCEGDDFWADPRKLQKQVDFLEVNPEYVITYHDAKIINQDGKIIKDSKLPESAKKDYSEEELMKAYFVLTLTMCYRNCLSSFPAEFEKISNGDSFLTSMLGQHGKGKYMGNIAPAVYRSHDTGVWSNLSELNKLKRRLQFYFYMTQYYNRLEHPSIRAYYLKKFDKLFYEYKELAKQLKEKQHLAYANKMYTKSICIDVTKSRLKRIVKMWLS